MRLELRPLPTSQATSAANRTRTARAGSSRQDRVSVLFDRYEAHGSAILRLLSQEDRIPAVRQMADAGRAYGRHWVERTFVPLLRDLRGASRERSLTAVLIAPDLLVGKLLRLDMGLDGDKAERVVAEMVLSCTAGRVSARPSVEGSSNRPARIAGA